MARSETSFNAWLDPFVPVIRQSGETDTLSLRGVLESAHILAGLGASLTPLDRDSLYRFLPSLGAVVARRMSDDALSRGRFTTDALDHFENNWLGRFNLVGGRPFLQRWDKSPQDLAELPARKHASPLAQLFPHEPGRRSSQWAVRMGASNDLSWPQITQLLITAWFQTLNGMGQDPWGGRMSKGSAATWHTRPTRPLSAFYSHPDNLMRTILANTPLAWLEEDDLPIFLDHAALTPEIVQNPVSQKASVARFTYAKSVPLIKTVAGRPVGFVIGPDSTIAVPPLGEDEKESLGLVHAHDHTQLHMTKNGSGSSVEPRGAFPTRLSTTEGMTEWVNSDCGIEEAVNEWRSVPRLTAIPEEGWHEWQISVLTDVADGKGNRQWAAWDTVPLSFAAAPPVLRRALETLLGFARGLRSRYLFAGRLALGESGRGVPGGVATGQNAFYNNIYPILLELVQETTRLEGREDLLEDTIRSAAARIRTEALASFDAATAPLTTPRQIADVAKGRAAYRKAAYKLYSEIFPKAETKEGVA